MSHWYGDSSKGRIAAFFGGDPTLTGYWQLIANSNDNSGNGVNGSDTSITYRFPSFGGRMAGAANFNGSSSLINMGNNFNVGTSDFAIMAWIRTTTFSSYRQIAGKSTAAGAGDWDFRLYNGTGKVELDIFDSTTADTVDGNIFVADGNWHFVVGQRNSATGKLEVYVDGKFDNSVTSNARNSSTTKNFKIGTDDGAHFFFGGDIAEVALFSRALTPSQIAQYYVWAVKKKTPAWRRAFSAAAQITKTVSVTMMNAAARFATVSRLFVGTRTASVTEMNAASRFATVARTVTLVRKATVTMMVAAGRKAVFVAIAPLWAFAQKHTASWSFLTKHTANWNFRGKSNTSGTRNIPSN